MEEFTINEVTYRHESSPAKYEIINTKKKRPRSFYKYYALSENSVDALSKQYLFATHPDLFNDPLDCRKDLISITDLESAEALLYPVYDKARRSMNKEELLEFTRSAFKEILFKKLGFVSLTTTNRNNMMWALYAQYSGFCLELDVDALPFEHFGPFPMTYTDRLTPISIKRYGAALSALYMSNIKDKSWAQENEWRLYIPAPEGNDMEAASEEYNLGGEHDRKFHYPTEAIKSVTLGYQTVFSEETYAVNEDIVEICTQCNDDKEKLFSALAKLSALPAEKRPVIQIWFPCIPRAHFIRVEITSTGRRHYRVKC